MPAFVDPFSLPIAVRRFAPGSPGSLLPPPSKAGSDYLASWNSLSGQVGHDVPVELGSSLNKKTSLQKKRINHYDHFM
jgi:hypothetical protein